MTINTSRLISVIIFKGIPIFDGTVPPEEKRIIKEFISNNDEIFFNNKKYLIPLNVFYDIGKENIKNV